MQAVYSIYIPFTSIFHLVWFNGMESGISFGDTPSHAPPQIDRFYLSWLGGAGLRQFQFQEAWQDNRRLAV